MGGKALSVPSVRLQAVDYHKLVTSVAATLAKVLPSLHVIEAYASKESFGDMDLVYANFEGYNPQMVAEALGAVEFVKNGEVTSFGVPHGDGLFQVDAIGVPKESVAFAANYFRFNDLGNLYGRMFKNLGLKFGHRGLAYVLRDDANVQVVAEIPITTDFNAALSIIGLKRLDRADTLEDVFNHVVESPWFSKSIYRIENLNNRSKTRDRKRPTYNAFLRWMDARNLPETLSLGYDRTELRRIIKHRCFDKFPDFQDRYRVAAVKYARFKANRLKFNGDLVRAWTGLNGVSLGAFMKAAHAILDYRLDDMPEWEVRATTTSFFAQWRSDPSNSKVIYEATVQTPQ